MKVATFGLGVVLSLAVAVSGQEETVLTEVATEVTALKACLFLDSECQNSVACTNSDTSGECKSLPGVPGLVFSRPTVPEIYHRATLRDDGMLEVELFGDSGCTDTIMAKTELVLEFCNPIPGYSFYLHVVPTNLDAEFDLTEETTATETTATETTATETTVTEPATTESALPVDSVEEAPTAALEPAGAATTEAVATTEAATTTMGGTTDGATTMAASTEGATTEAATAADAGTQTAGADDENVATAAAEPAMVVLQFVADPDPAPVPAPAAEREVAFRDFVVRRDAPAVSAAGTLSPLLAAIMAALAYLVL